MAEFESSQGGVSHIATRAQVLRIARYCEMHSHAATLHGVVGIGIAAKLILQWQLRVNCVAAPM
jgi:hypothetical protein